MGRLLDESGVGLTPSHAVKGERRYRYYLSRSLIKETAHSTGGGWRLPATEIERTVARRLAISPYVSATFYRVRFIVAFPRTRHFVDGSSRRGAYRPALPDALVHCAGVSRNGA